MTLVVEAQTMGLQRFTLDFINLKKCQNGACSLNLSLKVHVYLRRLCR